MTDDDPYDIELTRVFDAAPGRVYEAFTDPHQFARWYGLVGFPVCAAMPSSSTPASAGGSGSCW